MGKPTLLIVDDDAINLMVLRAMLEKAGYAPLEARDGIEAVEIALAERPDFILMDIMMPRMDGITAARAILRQAGERRPKIIAVTGNGVQRLRCECVEAGFESVVVKPVHIRELIADIERLAAVPDCAIVESA